MICSTHAILHRGRRFHKHLKTSSYFSQDQARSENGKLEVRKEFCRPRAHSSVAPDRKPLLCEMIWVGFSSFKSTILWLRPSHVFTKIIWKSRVQVYSGGRFQSATNNYNKKPYNHFNYAFSMIVKYIFYHGVF